MAKSKAKLGSEKVKHTLFVGGIAAKATLTDVAEAFRVFGCISEIRYKKTFAFVTFEQECALENATRFPPNIWGRPADVQRAL